jgi:hypothetical protein
MGDKETIRNIKSSMGFSFKKYKDRRSPLIEREDIVALRVFYL